MIGFFCFHLQRFIFLFDALHSLLQHCGWKFLGLHILLLQPQECLLRRSYFCLSKGRLFKAEKILKKIFLEVAVKVSYFQQTRFEKQIWMVSVHPNGDTVCPFKLLKQFVLFNWPLSDHMLTPKCLWWLELPKCENSQQQNSIANIYLFLNKNMIPIH